MRPASSCHEDIIDLEYTVIVTVNVMENSCHVFLYSFVYIYIYACMFVCVSVQYALQHILLITIDTGSLLVHDLIVM